MNQLEYQPAFQHSQPFASSDYSQAVSPQHANLQHSQHAQNQQSPLAHHQQHQQQHPSQAFAYPGQQTRPNPLPSPAHLFQDVSAQNSPQQQAQFAGQQNPYTTGPYSQSLSATSTPTAGLRHSASPQQGNSPYGGSQPQPHQQAQPKQQTPPIKYPMAAPPVPQTPLQQQHSAGGPRSPQSPGSQAREQQRIKVLFDINAELLKEINTLQAQGKGGATSPNHQVDLRAQNMDDKMASEEYIQCLRRVQANLAWLAPKMEPTQKQPLGPAHMTPPPHLPQLQPRYDQLRELFPGWQGHDSRKPLLLQQQQQQQYSSPMMQNAMNLNMMNGPMQA